MATYLVDIAIVVILQMAMLLAHIVASKHAVVTSQDAVVTSQDTVVTSQATVVAPTIAVGDQLKCGVFISDGVTIITVESDKTTATVQYLKRTLTICADTALMINIFHNTTMNKEFLSLLSSHVLYHLAQEKMHRLIYYRKKMRFVE